MATGKEKFQLVFDAQELASKKIRVLNRTLADLGGPKLVKSRKEIKKLEKAIESLEGSAQKSKSVFSRFIDGIALGNIIATGVTKALGLLSDAIGQIGKATMVAAEVQELGNVLQFVGQRAGYTSREITDYNLTLRKNGIAQKESNSAMLRAIQGNIDMADAVRLGRVAQDAAVIGQQNSSEAFQTLIDAVVKGRVVLLKSLGIQGTFAASYKKIAKTLGKTVVSLTEAEKVQARLNLVFEGGERIAGAYETAMGSASKQLRSYDRVVQDLQVSVGEYLVPTFSLLVTELTNVTKEMTETFGGDNKQQVRNTGLAIAEFVAYVILAGKQMYNLGQIVIGIVDFAIIAPVESAITVVMAFIEALSDPFNLDAWQRAGIIMEDVFDGFGTSLNSIGENLTDMGTAAIQYNEILDKLKAKAEEPINKPVDDSIALGTRVKKSFAALVALQDFSNEVIADEEEVVTSSVNGVVNVASRASQIASKAFGEIGGMANSGIDSMIASMVTGRESMSDVFKGIAQDFMSFFIKKALAMVLSTFIPGLGGLLGGMFDTPVNDRMAAQQGRDFMMWFTRGALAEAQGGTVLATGISGTSNRIAGVANNNSSGSGMVVMNISVSGNVLNNDYVEKSIAPQLQRLAYDGKTLLSTKDEHQTGGRDVSID